MPSLTTANTNVSMVPPTISPKAEMKSAQPARVASRRKGFGLPSLSLQDYDQILFMGKSSRSIRRLAEAAAQSGKRLMFEIRDVQPVRVSLE
jgi:hypothetical protein